MLVNGSADACVPDGGADSIDAERQFIPLTSVLFPVMKSANGQGLDDQTAQKLGLPIGIAITESVTN